LAGGRCHAQQISIRTQDIKELALDRRCGSSSGIRWLLIWIAYLANPRRPNLAPIFRRSAFNELILEAFVAKQIKAISNHRRRRVTRSHVRDLPNQLWPVLRPFLEQTSFLGNSISLRSAPLRRIKRVGWEGYESQARRYQEPGGETAAVVAKIIHK